MIYFLFFAVISLCVYFLLMFLYEPRELVRKRLSLYVKKKPLNIGKKSLSVSVREKGFRERIIKPRWNKLKNKYENLTSEKNLIKVERMLIQAGSPLRITALDYRLIQYGLFISFPFAAFLFSVVVRLNIKFSFLCIVLSLLIAFVIPRFCVKRCIRNRNNKALKELPDILDLINVSLEAGLGFDASIKKVVDKKTGVLAQALRDCLEAMRFGKTRKEALIEMAESFQLEELKSLVKSILQGERFGISMVQVLNAQVIDMREKRRTWAEEKAMKVPVKMIFPIVFFVFPSLFIITLGPSVLQLLSGPGL
ncbi:UNVERIFIED_CONTAM: tight adherence protein C [Acetivibrio alkalicellulosi]